MDCLTCLNKQTYSEILKRRRSAIVNRLQGTGGAFKAPSSPATAVAKQPSTACTTRCHSASPARDDARRDDRGHMIRQAKAKLTCKRHMECNAPTPALLSTQKRVAWRGTTPCAKHARPALWAATRRVDDLM